MVLLPLKHTLTQKPKGLMHEQCTGSFYHVLKFNFYLEELGARKDQTCDHLVKEVLISFHEPTIQMKSSQV